MHSLEIIKRMNREKQDQVTGNDSTIKRIDRAIRDQVNVAIKTINRKKFFDSRRGK